MTEKKQSKEKKKLVKKFVLITIAIILLIGIAAIIFLYNMAKSMGIGSARVEDYETRIEIWENAAGNCSDSKLDDMNINYKGNEFMSFISFAMGIIGNDYIDNERTLDTFTYLHEIKNGYEKETYEDVPYLIPYLVKGADTAVIILPGGGYGYKSMDGDTGEAKDVALSLNEQGISAFVLHYRSNPYEYPFPLLDVQRSVRFLRYNADDYGIDADKIGLIGFSAGGFEAGGFINLVMGENLFPDNYEMDKIDNVDDTVFAVGLIYPVLNYRYNVPMLFCSFDGELVRDDEEREKLLDMTDLSLHFHSSGIPQFLAYATEDTMVGTEGAMSYISTAEKAGADITVVAAEDQGHGFKQEYYMNDFVDWIKHIE